MKTENGSENTQKLLHAYPKMLQRIKASIHEWQEKSNPVLTKAIQRARESAVEFEELTQEEATLMADYVTRDLHYLGRFLAETGKGFIDWLAFDSQLLEQQLYDLMLSVADKSQLEWPMLQQHPFQPKYGSGDIVGIGTLYCTDCHHPLHFYKSSPVPQCPSCGNTLFARPLK